MNDILRSGDYARKQIYCPSRVVAWSHGSRFRLAARLASAAGAGRRLLDYGCGDGTFAQLDGVDFVHTSALADRAHTGAYGVVTCMEVLEHCVEPERAKVLDALDRAVSTTGRVIISVPIEVGPALLGKQMFRAIAAWRGHGDYRHRETYSPRELIAAALARPRLARAEYEVDTPSGPLRYCGHKGFDWRVLEGEIAQRFTIEERRCTPLPALGSLLNSQVWFVCRQR